jgi:aspartate ammonia-lyase
MGIVKQACYLSLKNLYQALDKEGLKGKLEQTISDTTIDALLESSKEIWDGKHFEHFIVPAIQGGAGTSINMNMNEIIANLSLIKLGLKPGSYSEIDPIETANIYQSTNDVVPTALRIATMKLLNELEESINYLRAKVEEKEKTYRNQPRLGYTQMQAAVPSTWGQLFSTYSDMLGRDWWRVSKCFERIKVVNLGGGAIGTGLGTPRFFIMDVITQLQRLSGFPVSRSENLNDATANNDALVEVHAILKSHAVNIEKMASDIRLLASDIAGNQIILPARQVGSSIMPGKVNPVICEYAVSVAHKVYANDMLISNLCGQGSLDLNAYLPVIGNALIESIKLLNSACRSLADNLFEDLKVNIEKSAQIVYKNPAVTTALLPLIGFNKATEMAKTMRKMDCDIFEANTKLGFVEESKIKKLLTAENLIKLGFSVREFE